MIFETNFFVFYCEYWYFRETLIFYIDNRVMFVALRTNLITSNCLITLVEAVICHSLAKFGDLLMSKTFRLKVRRFSATRGCGSAITVIRTLIADKATCLLFCLALSLFLFSVSSLFLFSVSFYLMLFCCCV